MDDAEPGFGTIFAAVGVDEGVEFIRVKVFLCEHSAPYGGGEGEIHVCV